MLSLNDKDEDQEEGLPLKPTQNDFVNEEEEERIPRARSKRARRAPKAVYDNDFEAHEIQNVRRLFFVSSSSLFLSLETFTTTRVPLEIRNNNKTTDDDDITFFLAAFLRACK